MMNTILIIEDDKVIRDELSRLLDTFGYRTVALEKFDNVVEDIKSFSYNLILLDINLPNENGFEICKRIKENNSVPIIFVTSRNSEEDKLRSIITGGSDFITKPYNKYILLEKIKRRLMHAKICVEKLLQMITELYLVEKKFRLSSISSSLLI